MNIRRAVPSDREALAEFNANTARETEGIELIPAVVSAGVDAMINNPQMGFYLVVEDGGAIQASLMVTTEWSDWRNGLFWWIQSVYVTTAYRRQGLYRKLYSALKAWPKTKSMSVVSGFMLSTRIMPRKKLTGHSVWMRPGTRCTKN